MPAPYSAWTDSCPLECTCPECGLRFEWADLLSPPRQRVPWLYEHAKHWWDVRRAWGTCLRALAPWWFWRRVQLHHAVVPVRLPMWAVITPLAVWLVIGTLAGAIAVISDTIQHDLTLRDILSAEYITFPVRIASKYLFATVEYGRVLTRCWYFEIHGAVAASLVCALVVPSIWRSARVSRLHLLRAAVYELASFSALYLAWSICACVHWQVIRPSGVIPTAPVLVWMNEAARRAADIDMLPGTLLVIAAWHGVWWWFALSRGMRIRRPFFAWAWITLPAIAVALWIAIDVGWLGGSIPSLLV